MRKFTRTPPDFFDEVALALDEWREIEGQLANLVDPFNEAVELVEHWKRANANTLAVAGDLTEGKLQLANATASLEGLKEKREQLQDALVQAKAMTKNLVIENSRDLLRFGGRHHIGM